MEEFEHFFNCPYCGKNISVLIDSSVSPQNYIEDCEICCHPIGIKFFLKGDVVQCWEALRTDG